MNKGNFDLLKSRTDSCVIYETFSESLYNKCVIQECHGIALCLENTLRVWLSNQLCLITGSTGEGTRINLGDYDKCVNQCYVSDVDFMSVLCDVRVIDEGDTLPQSFGNYMYCRAERGKHTTEGFRKLRIIYNPEYYSRQHTAEQWADIINMSVEQGYISSSQFLATTIRGTMYSATNKSVKTGKNFNLQAINISNIDMCHIINSAIKCFKTKFNDS